MESIIYETIEISSWSGSIGGSFGGSIGGRIDGSIDGSIGLNPNEVGGSIALSTSS